MLVQKPKNREAIESTIGELAEVQIGRAGLALGLPSRQEVQAQLAALSSDILLIVTKEQSASSDRSEFFYQSRPLDVYNDEQQKLFEQEFLQEIEGLLVRIQRIKICALKYELAGNLVTRDISEKGVDLNEKSPEEVFWKLTYNLETKSGILDEKEQRALVEGANSLMPQGHRISWSPFLSSHDAHLLSKLAGSMRFSEELSKEERKSLEPLMFRMKDIEVQLREMIEAPLLFSLDGEVSPYEQVLKDCRTAYRELVKQFAAFEESGSWFSPSYAESRNAQRGREQESKPFSSDYQRFRMPECLSLERALHKNLFRKTAWQEHANSFLFGGGLNALEGVFKVLELHLSQGAHLRSTLGAPKIFKTNEIYFEVDSAIEGFCRLHNADLEKFDPIESDKLLDRIKRDLPLAVFLNPMSNMFEMKISEVSNMLKGLCEWDWRDSPTSIPNVYAGQANQDVYIVIDNSTLGKLARWREVDFSKLPPFVRVVSFESLIKYAEDGLDLAPAALLTIIGEYTASDVDRVRRNLGFMPPESTIRKLEHCVDSETLERKMQRHSRNTETLCEALDSVANEDNFIQKVIHPFRLTHPQHELAQSEMAGAAGLCNVALNLDFLEDYRELSAGEFDSQFIGKAEYELRAESIAKGFTELVILLAKSQNLDLSLGTSYGFNTTRLALYMRLVSQETEVGERDVHIPYIRIACGTESIKDVLLLASILKRANSIYTEAIRFKEVLGLSKKLNRRELEMGS